MNIIQLERLLKKNKVMWFRGLNGYKKYIPKRIKVYLKTTIRDFKNRRSSYSKYISKNLSGKRALEFGGPSKLFEDKTLLPTYRVLESLDNLNYSEHTLWDDIVIEHHRSFPGFEKVVTEKRLCFDATNLDGIEDCKYEVILASHVIEHIANPLKALKEWFRVMSDEGVLIIIAPKKEVSFDNKRPVTLFSHIKDDYLNGVAENDNTHFEEVLNLHDLEKDTVLNSKEEFVARVKNNYKTRCVHHHIFDENTLAETLKFAGFTIHSVELFRFSHIVAIAKK